MRISERLLPVITEFQAATNLYRDPYGIVCYMFTYVNRDKNRTVSVPKSIKITNRTNAFPNAMGAIRPNSDHLSNAFFCGLTDRIQLFVVSEHTPSRQFSNFIF
jgi:hypothetical protein